MASSSSAEAPIRKVLLVGANGTVGSVILEGLVQARCFDVSVLRRSNSSSSGTAAGIADVTVSPQLGLDELVAAIAGHDAVVAAFPLKDVDQHLRLVEAAFRAGVRRYIPADYGSCDAASPQAQAHLKLYRDKTAVRDKCEELASRNPSGPFSWTSIICGHFFDYGLRDGLLHVDLDAHTAQILDAGDIKASASTLRRVAESVVAVLQRPRQTRNRAVYVQSFCPTQLEILASLERATGRKWHTQHLDSNAFLERESRRLAAGDHDAIEGIVFVLGTVDADWTRRDGFAMELLGLEDENLDDVVAAVVAEHAKEKASS
ncbi:NmrA family transcriptional regulator [Tolypocladium paradoxum]|uniref:NmrA family transcriptional regulator n=1 Tax=Tolypocladium paradoxum TaxID=94208 RepID=A0A2S4KNV1_9HYPO|nr:NmrA family transcriptional regulator [Tolypocladium paradoxum]